MAFRKQVRWLHNTSKSRLHVICYDKRGIAGDVSRVLQMVGSNCSVAAINQTINRTTRPAPRYHNASSDAETPQVGSTYGQSGSLSPNQSAWVVSQYLEDAQLYRALCEPHLSRLTMPHSLPTDLRWLPGVLEGHGLDPARVGTNGWATDYRKLVDAIAPVSTVLR